MHRRNNMSTDIIDTKEKVDEALYFLLEMRHNYVDRKRFIYNMNAFLNSARNITFSLQAYTDDNKDLKDWYSKKQAEMNKDSIFDFFNKLRVVSVHKKGTPKHKLSIKIAYIFPKDGKRFDATTIGYSDRKLSNVEKLEIRQLALVFPSETGYDTIEPAYTLVSDWQFEKAPEGYDGCDILALSINYFHKIRKIVEEAEDFLSKSSKPHKTSSC